MSLQLVLERDGHDQAWGFRLQGGSDVGLPLSIQRVLVGTPSESVLKRGDLVVRIGNIGTHSLTHQQAVDLFSAAGNKCIVTVKRAMTGAPQTPPSAQPTVSSLQATAAARQQKQQEAPQTQEGLVNAASDHQKQKSFAPTSGPIPGPTPLKLPSSPIPKANSPAIVPAKYNSAGGLYANPSSGYLKKPAGMVNPSGRTHLASSVNQPQKNLLPFFALSRKYDPEQSATWQAIHELENCQLVTEHGPTESKVYSI